MNIPFLRWPVGYLYSAAAYSTKLTAMPHSLLVRQALYLSTPSLASGCSSLLSAWKIDFQVAYREAEAEIQD